MGVVLVLANSQHSFDSDRFLDVCHYVLIVNGSTQYMIRAVLVLDNSPHSFDFNRVSNSPHSFNFDRVALVLSNRKVYFTDELQFTEALDDVWECAGGSWEARVGCCEPKRGIV